MGVVKGEVGGLGYWEPRPYPATKCESKPEG